MVTSSNEPEGLDNSIEVHELGAIDFGANTDNVRNTVLTNSAGCYRYQNVLLCKKVTHYIAKLCAPYTLHQCTNK